MGDRDQHVRIVRVVLSSPSDVARERSVAQKVIDEINRTAAADHGCRLSLWRWEVDARPGVDPAGSQVVIDKLMHIEDADVVVGVFWKRFGTPTGTAASGTEHELQRAWETWQERGRPELMVYFCKRAHAPDTADELAQWQRVVEYRDGLPAEQLWWPYASVSEFEGLLREHLTRYIRSRFATKRLVYSEAPGRRVRFNVPAVAAAFAGRDGELEALDDALGSSDRVLITQAITGLGGVGKSQLAARYVQRRAEAYDVVAWIRAEDGGIADLAAFAGLIGEPGDAVSASQRARAALDWLAGSTERWLLVLDNVASPEQLEGLHPHGGTGRVLVTSRDWALRQYGPALVVDVFGEDAATAYLMDRADRPGEEADARRLARAVGCLPLALSHAAAYCSSGTSFADYLALLDELPARELFDGHPELIYAQTVTSTWKTSIQASTAQAPLAADVLEMAAHLGADAIPKSLFDGLVEHPEAAPQRKQLLDSFNALARFSLATVNDDSVSVHRLLQKTIRDDSEARGDQTAALRALDAICAALPDDVSRPAHWQTCERLLPHALALALALPEPAGDAGQRLTHVLNELCQYLNWSEPGVRGLQIAQATVRYARKVLAPGDRESLVARCRVAAAHRYEEETEEAIALFETLLADSEHALGNDDPDTLTVRHLLAYSYHTARRLDEAVAIYEQVLADRERVCGPEHPDTLMSRNNLAVAYCGVERNGAALALFERVLPERQRVIGAEHPSTLTTRHNFALCTLAAGHVREAIEMFTALLADRERVLGIEHPQTLLTRASLERACGSPARDPPSAEEWLGRLVAHRTVVGASNLGLLDEVEAFLTMLGVPCVRFPGTREGTASLYATIGPDTDDGVLLAAHTDVVAADGAAWSSDPFALVRRGSRLFGRGTTDMKGFIAAALGALPALMALDLRRPLSLALSADEELGVRGVRPMLRALADRSHKPAFCVVGEPTRMRVAVAHKGKIAFRVTLCSEPRHSSDAPNASSAIDYAARTICELYAHQARLAEDCRDMRFPVPYATVNVGRLEGGASVGVVADRCSFDAEIRALPSQDHEALMAPVRHMLDRMQSAMRERVPLAGVAAETLCDYPGLDVGGDVPRLVAQLAESDAGIALDFGTEAGLYQRYLNVPVVVCGPGDIAQAHTTNEYVEAAQLARAERFVHRIGDFLTR